jgi:molecular chaperone DnaK
MTDTPVLGIDFGTTNSVVSYVDTDGPHIISVDEHQRLPSVLSYRDDEFVVGEEAVRLAEQHPDRTVFAVKQFLGSGEELLLGDESFPPETLAAGILTRLVDAATAELGEPVDRAVITVPAYFDHQQRAAVKRAGEEVGLTVERLLPEPTAACLPHGLRQQRDAVVLVYDLGGGTFDASLVDLTDGVFDVVASRGDTELGGADWDGVIVDWLFRQIEAEHGVELRGNVQVEERLFAVAQAAKHDLTTDEATTIEVQYRPDDEAGFDIDVELTRNKFEEWTADLLARTSECCTSLVDETDYEPGDIDEILLAGGSTRMPQVERMITETFGIDPRRSANPDAAVAIGAAIQGAVIAQESTPKRESGESISVTDETTIRPQDVVLLDVTAQSLGIEARADAADGGSAQFVEVIRQDATLPASGTELCSTVEDGQTFVRSDILQSPTGSLDDATVLERFEVGPLPPQPAGTVELEIQFTLDVDGVLTAEIVTLDGATTSTEIEVRPEIDHRRRDRLDGIELPPVRE